MTAEANQWTKWNCDVKSVRSYVAEERNGAAGGENIDCCWRSKWTMKRRKILKNYKSISFPLENSFQIISFSQFDWSFPDSNLAAQKTLAFTVKLQAFRRQTTLYDWLIGCATWHAMCQSEHCEIMTLAISQSEHGEFLFTVNVSSSFHILLQFKRKLIAQKSTSNRLKCPTQKRQNRPPRTWINRRWLPSL